MEFGDIVYLILIIGFMFFGFFKELMKKNKKTTADIPKAQENFGEMVDEYRKREKKKVVPPPHPVVKSREDFDFQSSMGLVTDFEGESSLKGYHFEDHLQEEEAEDYRTTDPHPVLSDLTGRNRYTEMKKAIIYTEILQRKY